MENLPEQSDGWMSGCIFPFVNSILQPEKRRGDEKLFLSGSNIYTTLISKTNSSEMCTHLCVFSTYCKENIHNFLILALIFVTSYITIFVVVFFVCNLHKRDLWTRELIQPVKYVKVSAKTSHQNQQTVSIIHINSVFRLFIIYYLLD